MERTAEVRVDENFADWLAVCRSSLQRCDKAIMVKISLEIPPALGTHSLFNCGPVGDMGKVLLKWLTTIAEPWKAAKLVEFCEGLKSGVS
jgi:hypothetical protein